MATKVILPKLGQTMEEGTIVSWLKKEGDPVSRGDVLFELESDKAVLEVESRTKGVLLKILVQEGQRVPVLTPVGIIGEPGEDISALLQSQEPSNEEVAIPEREGSTTTPNEATHPAPAEAPERIFASPRARKLAREEGVDLKAIQGSGPHGRIVERDVRAFLERQPATTPLAQRLAQELGVQLEELPTTGERITAEQVRAAAKPREPQVEQPEPQAAEIVPLSGLRAIIAQRMAQSAHTTAAVTLQSEVDATELVSLRNKLKEALFDELGFNIGYNDILGVIVARCLVEFPYMNAQLGEDGIHYQDSVNLGMAVDSERGLLVPVVHDAHRMGIKEFAIRFRELVERARSGKALPDDLTGGTFTITNLGMFGVDMFTPIINLPECAILGVGRIRPVPAVVNDQVVSRQRMWLSLTFDHRLVDGAPAARFLQAIMRYIENPYLLLA